MRKEARKDFLLEIGTEPLPARFVAPALAQLKENVENLLRANNIGYSATSTKGYATLRRLTVVVEGLEPRSSPIAQEVTGPPARLLKDQAGKYTVQAEGFARKYGLSPEDLRVVQTPKGEFLQVVVSPKPEATDKILARELPGLFSLFDFPKFMEWEESRFKFGRPMRSIAALYGKSVVAIKVAGIRSSRHVSGLAAQGKKPFALAEPSKYKSVLKNALVIVDPEERRDVLVKRLESAAKEASARLDLDLDLLEETVYMTEQPTPVVGRFRKEFLSLPAPLLALVLKKQLKFFPLLQGSGLAAAFVGVRDGASEGQGLVREGYERVLTARLSDAVFFFQRDKASRLETRVEMLERVTYQKGLGTMAEKTERVRGLAGHLCGIIRQDHPVNEQAVASIAGLCYADLVTDVVKEFPELQGTMGGVYARHDGHDERVALGVEQFYQPLSAKSPLPATFEGAVASLAGKLDTLAGNFAIGQIPTGSADPLALRRQATGVIRILLEKQLPIDLEPAAYFALKQQPIQEADWSKGAHRELIDFLWARAQSLFEEKGFKADEIRAVRAGGLRHLAKTYLRLAAVSAVRKEPDFEPLAAAFKRAANILRQAKIDPSRGEAPDRALLKDEAEFALYDALVWMEGEANRKFADDGFEPGLRSLVEIKPHLDRFFDKVMVMAEDPALRRQRLSLLAKLVRLFNSVADLSELQSPSAN